MILDSGTADLSTQLTQQYVIYFLLFHSSMEVLCQVFQMISQTATAVNAFLAACDSIKETFPLTYTTLRLRNIMSYGMQLITR